MKVISIPTTSGTTTYLHRGLGCGVIVYPRVSLSFPEFPQPTLSFPELPQVSPSFPGFPQVSPSFPTFAPVFPRFPAFPRVSPRFPTFPRVSPRFPEFPWSSLRKFWFRFGDVRGGGGQREYNTPEGDRKEKTPTQGRSGREGGGAN